MTIYEALEKTDNFFERLIEKDDSITEEDKEVMNEIESAIYQFAMKYEPLMTLPLTFPCTCGRTMYRHDIYDDMSRFFCECGAEWLIGPQVIV